MKPTCFVSFPRQSVLLERYIHVVGRVPVVFMRGKCMEAIDPGHVLENCAVCLVFLQEKKSTDKFRSLIQGRWVKLILYSSYNKPYFISYNKLIFSKGFSVGLFFRAGLLSEEILSWKNCRLIFRRNLTCEKFRCILESCVLKLLKHNDVKHKRSQSTICLKYYNESRRRTNRKGVIIGKKDLLSWYIELKLMFMVWYSGGLAIWSIAI